MLDEIIKELTTKSNNEQATSKGVLVWAKIVEAQWAQTAILSDIMETHQFDKVKLNPNPRDNLWWVSQDKEDSAGTAVGFTCQDNAQHMGRHAWDAEKLATSGRCVKAKETVVHELEVDVAQETHEANIETVSINSVHLNRNWSLITAY